MIAPASPWIEIFTTPTCGLHRGQALAHHTWDSFRRARPSRPSGRRRGAPQDKRPHRPHYCYFRNFTFFPVLSRGQGTVWRPGYVSAAVAEDHDDLAGAKAYVAGPPAMVDASLSVLIDRGVSARDIHADVFFTPEETTSQMEKPL